MPSGRPSGTLFSAQSLLWVSLPPSFALPGRVEAENWSARGPKGVSGGPRKSPKIDSKSLSVPIGGLRRAGGCLRVPPRCLRDTQGAYLCIFMHVFMHIHAYSCIFMHIYVYLCISWIQGKYIYSKHKVLHHWTQFKLLINHYRNNQHIFRCCTGMTPWHGGGLGAVRL